MVTLSQIKSALGITTTKHDEQITTLIPLVYDVVKERRSLIEVPEAHDDTIIQIIGYRLVTKLGVSSETLSRHSQSFDADFEEKQIRKIGRKLKW